MVACANAAEMSQTAHSRKLMQGWPWPRLAFTTPFGKWKIAPYRTSVQNIVGGNFENVYLTGRGGRKLMQGWPWPRLAFTTPFGKWKIAPYRTSVQNIVGGNFENIYLTGRGGKKL